jgi:hypothetical protein
VAALLNVNEQTIRRWIEAETVPYLKLPSGSTAYCKARYLLTSLRGNDDPGAELRELDERNPVEIGWNPWGFLPHLLPQQWPKLG